MTALVLLFLACSPTGCREVALPWDGGLQACMIHGQQLVAAYATERGLTVPRGYRCTTGREA
jgi:hypothetical protein